MKAGNPAAYRDCDSVAVSALRLQVLALQAEEVGEDGGGQVRRAQAVLKAVVAGAGEDQVRQTQLLQVAQALELRRVCVATPARVSADGSSARASHA